MQDFSPQDLEAINENNNKIFNTVIPIGIRTEAFRLKQLQLTGTRFRTAQIPNKENEQTAVVEAELQTNRGTYGGIGAASAESFKDITDSNMLLKKAMSEAIINASAVALLALKTQENTLATEFADTTVNASQMTRTEPAGKNQQYQKHSTTKPASDKQLGVVKNICAREGISEQQAREVAGVHTSGKMTSADAHEVISHFNGRH